MQKRQVEWLAGESDMARQIRDYDWAATPLGPIERWPLSLRAALNMVLDHPLPMALVYGPELISLYNDAYRPLLGGKPSALGIPFLEVWEEARAIIAPQIAQALAGESLHFEGAAFMLVRGGRPEEAFFDYSFSPMRDESGAIAGVLNTAIETTARFLAERRQAEVDKALRESEMRFRALVTASTYSIYRMSPDWRAIYQLDSKILASTTEPIEGWVDKYILEEDRLLVSTAIEHAIRTRSLFELEHRVKLADGGVGWVLSRAVPILNADGEITEWFGTGSDVNERRQAEAKLQESEAKLAIELADIRQLQRSSSSLIQEDNVHSLYAEIVDVARSLMRSEMASIQRLVPEKEQLHLLAQHGFAPESAEFWEWVAADSTTSCGVALAHGDAMSVFDVESWDLIAGTEDLRHYRLSDIRAMLSAPLISRDGRLVGMISTHWSKIHKASERELRLLDVLARQAADLIERSAATAALRESEDRQAFLLSLSDELSKLETPDKIVEAAGTRVGARLGLSGCLFADVNEALDEVVIHQAWNTAGVPSPKQTFRMKDYVADELQRAGRRGEPTIIRDTQIDPRTDAKVYVGWQAGAYVVIPFHRDGRWTHFFAVSDTKSRDWAANEISLFKDVCDRVFPRLERARAEAALRASEENFRALSNATPALVWVCKAPTGENIYFNDRWHEYTGQTREESAGYGWTTATHPADWKWIAPLWERCQNTGEIYAGEVRYRRHDGEYHWFTFRALPTRNGAGELEAWYGTSIDINDQKEAEEALRASEEKYRTLFEVMDEGFVILERIGTAEEERRDFRYVVGNPAWARHTGHRDWVNRTVLELTPAMESSILDKFDTALQTGEPQIFEAYISSRDLWVHAEAFPTHEPRQVAVIFSSITNRKRAEEALRTSEERFRLFVDNVHEYALVQTDPEGVITSWNPGAQRLFGYGPEQMLGQDFSVLFTAEDQKGGLFREELAVVARGQRNEDARWFVRQDSSRFWAHWVTEPMLDEAGRFRGLAKIMRDETERERADVFTRHSLAEKEELLKEIHHRVKNNLQVIISLLNMQTFQIQDEGVLALFQETRNRVLAISSIHELLYRAESFANVSLAAYAQQLVPGLVRFYGLEQRVQVEVVGNGMTLELERAVPYGMLLNELVSNACKHAFPSSRAGTITISVQSEGDAIVLTVADTGPGLPDGFNYQKASSLGLKLVHGLVQQLRGTIEISSKPGVTVKARFPATGTEPE